MHRYDIYSYGRMVADKIRTDGYACALRQSVKPNDVVLDMGTGIGILALLACTFGARKVYALEPNDVIEVARENAQTNGYADRIEFIQDMSTQVTLPEQVDLVVTEMHGVLPMFEQNLLSIIDARRRLLAPGGRVIPEKERMWAAVVEALEAYEHITSPWTDNPYGIDLRPALPLVTNMWRKPKKRITASQFITEPKCWATLDYITLETPNVTGETTWIASRKAIAHGLLIWFETVLTPDVSFSNAPDRPELIFGQAFFPWPEPVSISIGDNINVAIRADFVGGDYVWTWKTRVLARSSAETIKAKFQQSTFLATKFSPKTLLKRASSYSPILNEDGELEQFIVSLTDGRASIGEIADRVLKRFPARFPRWEDALTHVADLSEKYSR